MANQLNEFDKMIKESLEGYEAPYDHSHWEELEEELNATAPGISTYFGAVTTGLVLTGIVFIGMLFFNSLYFNGTLADEHPDDEKITGTGVLAENQSGASTETAILTDITDSIEQEDTQKAITDGLSSVPEDQMSLEDSENMKLSDTENSGETDSPSEVPEETSTEIEISESDNSPKLRMGCTGMTIDFNASEEYGKDAHFLWNFGDGFFSNEANPSHTFNKEGIFDVSLSVTSPSSGQITSNVVQAMIEVVEAPIANLELDIESPELVKLGNKSYNATEIQWKLDGEIVSAKPEINVSLADNTHYQLSLIAYNEGGCSDTLQAELNSVIAGNEFPKAYETSYGASFAPGAIIDDGTVTSIKIFEKSSGNLVFEGSGSKGWEGTDLGGKDANPGKYQWVMMVNKSDAIDIYHGEIQLR